MGTRKTPLLYKLTRDGQSPHTYYEWTLPSKDEPGAWHEVSAGPLVEHQNGFHLTSQPKEHWRNGLEVWLVETEGDVQRAHSEDTWLARKVRLVKRLGPADLDKLNVGVVRSWRSSGRVGDRQIRKRIPEGASPAVRLMTLVHDHALTSGNRRGDNLFNTCMARALELVIEARMEFGIDDVATIAKLDDGILNEWRYSALVKSGNISACKSWEKTRRREPWRWQKARLHQGARLPWAGRDCKITTIDDRGGRIIACAYKKIQGERFEDRETVIEKRFTITREELAEGDRRWSDGHALREAIEETAKAVKREGAEVDPRLVALWSAEERETARAWAVLSGSDAGKSRVAPPEKPGCVDRDHAITNAANAAQRTATDAYFALPHHQRGEYPEEKDPQILAAGAAVQAWHLSGFVGVPSDYLKKTNKRAAGPERQAA